MHDRTKPNRSFYEAEGLRPLDAVAARVDCWRLRQILRHIPPCAPGAVVCDFGAGRGELIKVLAQKGAFVLGIDLARTRLKAIRHLLPAASLLQADAARLPLRTQACDLALCIEVLEHMEDSRPAIGEAAADLKAGGLFVAAVPHEELLQDVTCMHCGKSFPLHGHLQSFCKARLEQMLIQAGLDPIEAAVFGRSPVLYALRRRALPDFMLGMLDLLSGVLGFRGGWLVVIARKKTLRAV